MRKYTIEVLVTDKFDQQIDYKVVRKTTEAAIKRLFGTNNIVDYSVHARKCSAKQDSRKVK